MNANELIEELEDTGSFFEDALYLKSAALLRQLQAEIEALKRPNNVVGVPQDKLFEMQATIHEQQAEIEALKKLVHQRFDDGKRLGIIETEDRLRKAQDNG